jgi:hypothetical protein
VASIEIHSVQTTSGNQPRMRRIIEEAGQVFLSGVPVQVKTATDGGIIEWDGATVANALAGFAKEAASNLGVTGTAKTLSFGSVPNEASAVNIPRGAPLNDGRIGFEAADNDTVFLGQVGPAQTTAATDVGKQYGMTKDADNHWFVDKTKTGGSAILEIVKLDPNDQSATPRGVYFVILPAAAQITA